MTYNFDAEAWYDRERAALERARRAGSLDEEGFRRALEALERRFESMLARLDGTYRLPGDPDPPRTTDPDPPTA